MPDGVEFEKEVKKLISAGTKSRPHNGKNPPPRSTHIDLDQNAREIFNRRYRRKNADGTFAETIEGAFARVAKAVASAEETPSTQAYFTNVFYNLLAQKEFIPNAPTWTGAGTPLGQLAACFVLPIKDDMGSHPEGIFSTLKNAALIQQTGGGNGFSFSRLRPKGDLVNSSMGRASGPVGFLQVYDAAFGEIAQGGVRRGANMAVLRIDHPDVRDFIKCKSSEGKVTNFNISVALTDEFMRAVRDGTKFELKNPRDGAVWERVSARQLFEMIVDYAHKNGEPGVLFIDRANRDNPVPNQYELEATNPCGEQWLGPFENCCLGHINLAKHVKGGKIDWGRLAQTTRTATRFLDNVISANAYVPAVPRLKEAAYRNRRIGLGFLGLGDVMYQMGVRYGSPAGAELAAQITEFLRYHAMQQSISLAEERGAFPGITGSIYDPKNLTWQIPLPLEPYQHDWGQPKLTWSSVERRLRAHGIRNSAQMTVAPTGSTATVLGVEGYGCEPVFALAYERKVYQAAGHEENLTLKYVSPLFQKALQKLDLSRSKKEAIVNEILDKGTCQHIDKLPQKIRETFVVSADITPSEHVLMQASIQAFIDNSISKTCNFPNPATKKDVWRAYFQAWEMGCKGLTIYRAGSREEIVLATKETQERHSEKKGEARVAYVLRPRPTVLTGETHAIQTPLGKMFMTVNRAKDGELHEVFVNLGKAGTDTMADATALGRLISLVFRLGPSATSLQKLDAVVDQLIGIKGGQSVILNKERVLSIPDAIAKVLKRIKNPNLLSEQGRLDLNATNTQSPGDKDDKVASASEFCPECGNYTVVLVEGCKKCLAELGGCGRYTAC